MLPTSNLGQWRRRATFGASVLAILSTAFATSSQSAGVDAVADAQKTATPIKHVIVSGWREPHLRPCICDLCPDQRGFDLEPALQRDHQRRRITRSPFQQGRAI